MVSSSHSKAIDLLVSFNCFDLFFKDALLGLWFTYDDREFVDFLSLLELCLKTFKYRGKNNIEKLK